MNNEIIYMLLKALDERSDFVVVGNDNDEVEVEELCFD